jgi:hypothetical protein
MKLFSFSTLLAIILVSGMARADQAPPVILFLDASVEASRVGERPANDASLAKAIPVPEGELREAGWLYMRLDGRYTGYIETLLLKDGGTLQANSPIQTAPRADAPVIFMTDSEWPVSVREQATGWSKVDFRGPVLVYFNPTLPYTPEIVEEEEILVVERVETVETIETIEAVERVQTPEGPEIVVVEATTVQEETVVQEAGIIEDTIVTQETVEPVIIESTEETTPLVVMDPVMISPPAPVPAEGPPPVAPASTIPRYFEGTLALSRPTGFFRNTPPPAPYRLLDAKGDTVAFIELNDVILPRPVDQLINQRVVVHGVLRTVDPKPGTLIKAQLLQLK